MNCELKQAGCRLLCNDMWIRSFINDGSQQFWVCVTAASAPVASGVNVKVAAVLLGLLFFVSVAAVAVMVTVCEFFKSSKYLDHIW